MKTMNINHTKAKWLSAVFLFFLSLFLLSLFSLSFFNNSKHTSQIHTLNHIQLIATSTCEDTLYPDICSSTISTLSDLHRKSIPEIISGILNITISEVHASETNCTDIKNKRKTLHLIDRRALDDCLELFHDTVDELKQALSYLSSDVPSSKYVKDLNILFSAAMTNQYTCLDGFAYGDKNLRSYIEGGIRRISHHVSNSLALLKKVKKATKKKPQAAADVDGEDFPLYGIKKDGFPAWLKKKDRALLEAPVDKIKVNVVVAQDGSGNFTTINQALEAAPQLSSKRFVIYIKAGEYYEYVEVVSGYRNIMFLGDGIGKTLIKGNRSVGAGGGMTTYRSFTVAVVGVRFMARGITFENFAGPRLDQAVALRSNSEFSAFYKCSFLGYQDTLYVHSFRQFYTHCDIYGTVDFIFGNAAVVFQRCNLYARKPNPGQSNVYTAQNREDPNENTGISIIDCNVAAAKDLIPVQHTVRTYLGRPWGIYSRTVYLLSDLHSLIDPKGWVEWPGGLGLDTLYYGEYENRGTGSNTSQRVDWPGYRVITNSTVASQFTVGNFIQGDEWLLETGFPYYPDLLPPSLLDS